MEHLIEVVKSHPVLYDKNHPDYMKPSVKDEVWAKLAAELGYRDGMDIKEQWRKLRECHREALRRQYNKRRRGHGIYTTKMWMYQKQMEFLLPFMAQRGPDTTLMQESPEEEFYHQLKMEDSSEDQPSTSERDRSPGGSRQRSRKKMKLDEQQETVIPEPVFDRQQSSEQDTVMHRMQDAVFTDSLYHFFMCMYNTVKGMPLPTQLKVKKSIFEVVVDAEEDLVEELGVHHLV